jgi:DNA-binding XRE family transcriptional regulator
MPSKSQEIRKILSNNLKKHRIKMDFTQEKLAEMAGLSVQTINDIEGGRKWVSDKTIIKLSVSLGIECYQLLLPDINIKKKDETTPTQSLIELKRNIQKIIGSIEPQIEMQFMDFIKSEFFNT